MNRPLLSTPDAVVDPAGAVHYGVFDTPFRRINLLDAAIRTGPAPWLRALRSARLKEWQHFWIGRDDVFFGLAVVDAKYMKVSFASVVDRAQGTFVERSIKPPTAKVRIPETLWDDHGYYRSRGYDVAFRNQLEQGRHELDVDIAASRRCPAIRGRLVLDADLTTRPPLIAVLPVGGNRAMYSHKSVLPASGELTVGERTYTFDPSDTRCIVDVHKAHYPYRMWWHWATMWGWDDEGNEVGLNLTDNVCLDKERLNECAVWYQGTLHRLAGARITHPPDAPLEPWDVGTTDGGVRLRFVPEGQRQENLNFGVMMSRFHQPYGTFTGEIDLPDGRTIRLERGWGVCEDHRARW